MTALNDRQARFHDAVRDEWNDAHTIAAWRKWAPSMSIQTRAATDAIVAAAQVRPGMSVLDIASGTGEPALTLAEVVGPAGKVTATDLGAGMLAAAEEIARGHSVGNVTFQQADVHELPFADASFDRVTCRFGVMYFANIARALSEVHRVLRPQGRAAFIAWGSPDQPFMRSTAGVLFSNLPAPPPPPEPDAPGPFRFAEPGTLTRALDAAGFGGIEEQAIEVPLPWPGTAVQLCEHFFEVAAPFRPVLQSFEPEKSKQVLAQVVEALCRFETGGRIEMAAKLVLASAAR